MARPRKPDERQLVFPSTTVTLPARRGTIVGERYRDRIPFFEGSACSPRISRFVDCGNSTRRARPPLSPRFGRAWMPRPHASTAGSAGFPARYGCHIPGVLTPTPSPMSGMYCAPRTGHKKRLGELEWTDVQHGFGNPKTAIMHRPSGFRLGVTFSSAPAQRNLTASTISPSTSVRTTPQILQESHSPTPNEFASACTRPPRIDESDDTHPPGPHTR